MRIATFNLQNMRLRADHLEGARDADMPKDQQQQSQALDHQDRRLSAQVIRDTQADIIALQEVFDLPSLEAFHDRFLVPPDPPIPIAFAFRGMTGAAWTWPPCLA